MIRVLQFLFSFVFVGLIANAAYADELTRWSVFDPSAEYQKCGSSPNNVARSYCYDELDKKLRRGIRWANGFVIGKLSKNVSLPDSFPDYGGKYAAEAINALRATSDAYSKLIASDCKVASWEMRGGSGQGLLAQACEIGHRTTLFVRYKIFF
jgi:hypothetical protein